MANRYLVVGIRGGYELRVSRIPVNVESALLHTLDERWGIAPPWGPCDSGADLATPGNDVLRGWTHVDLRVSGQDPPSDVPVSALLRTTWDALELYGETRLEGVEVIAPLEGAGDLLWERVLASPLRDADRISRRRPRIVIELGKVSPDSADVDWDAEPILATVGEFVDAREISSADEASDPTFAPAGPFASSDSAPLRMEVSPPDWTIDDAGWLAEAIVASCQRTGAAQDIHIVLRRMSGPV